jgi:glutamate dehydrogenase/leucine dehydrogenase
VERVVWFAFGMRVVMILLATHGLLLFHLDTCDLTNDPLIDPLTCRIALVCISPKRVSMRGEGGVGGHTCEKAVQGGEDYVDLQVSPDWAFEAKVI